MLWLLALGGLALMAATAGGKMALDWFQDSEFRGWKDEMDPELLQKLDAFRQRLGYPVRVSPAEGAIGRRRGPDESRHNIDRWGQVQAIDVMPTPPGPTGKPGPMGERDARQAIAAAEAVGFGGIGVYPGWDPYPGMHLDVRPIGGDNDVDRWGGLPNPAGGQTYVAQEQALTEWRSFA